MALISRAVVVTSSFPDPSSSLFQVPVLGKLEKLTDGIRRSRYSVHCRHFYVTTKARPTGNAATNAKLMFKKYDPIGQPLSMFYE